MVFNGIVPWYDRPAREFPAKRWMRERYHFSLPPLHVRPGPKEGEREFPAKVWVRARQAGMAELSARAYRGQTA